MTKTSRLLLAAALLAPAAFSKTSEGKPLAVLIAGRPSHGPGEHEHNAGVQLLAKGLAQGLPALGTKVLLNGEWPDAATLAQADTILIYSDGGGGHPALKDGRLAQLDKEMKRGVGFVCLHYAVEVPKSPGGPEFREWLGGYFEPHWSVNPHWTANFTALPAHPISSGVKPFSTNDEWYYHMRFREAMAGVTPILTDLPPEATLKRGDGPHSGNPDVRKAVLERKEKQHVAWAVERPDGGRGFGFTGGHFHKGWANDDQRKLVLNAIAWTAKVAVPASGVESAVSGEDMAANLDPKGQPKSKPAANVPTGSGKPVASTGVVKAGMVETIKADLKGAKELYLVTTDAGDGFVADWSNWAEPVLIKADGSKVKLTEIKPKASKVAWGSLGVNKNAAGNELKIKGQPVPFGFGAHAPSSVAFDLPEGVVAFEAKAGIDNGGTDQGGGSTATFHVYTQAPEAKVLVDSQQKSNPSTKPHGLAAAKENMASFKTADGLSAGLFAAEPMVQNPTNIDLDHRGRVWAVECINYRRYGKIRPEGDRVVILEDKNGDGEADVAKTFFQKPELTNPLGICVLPMMNGKGTQAIVSAAPNVWLLTDADGDDVAEDAKIVFKTTGTWDYDHQIHAFVFGPEGKFYFNFGDAATSLTWPDGSVVKDMAGNEITNKGTPYRKGMVFRCDLDLATGKASNVETLGHNFRNNYEVAVDSFGAMWQSDNDDDGNRGVRINYVMEFGNYGYTDEMTGAGWRTKRLNMEKDTPEQHWFLNDPGVVPNLLQTGAGSPTGILVNEGNGLGAAFKNEMIHCDAGPRTTRAYPVEKSGAGYTAKMVDVLTSSDSWYRVADVGIAPDGALLVADWYDPGVGGHNMGDNDGATIRGRVYRVAAGKLAAPKIDVSTAEGAVQALSSPNLAARSLGWRALHTMGAKAEPALAALLKSTDPRLRARALGVLANSKTAAMSALRAGLTDSDEDVRVAAIRFATTLERSKVIDTTPLDSDQALVGKLLRDTPGVRRQIALSLYRSHKIEKLWAALAMQHDGKDRWYLEALGIGATGNEDLCFDTWLAMVGDKWNTPAGRDIVWRMRSAKSAGYLAQIIEGKDVADADKPRFVRAFDFLPASEPKSKALVELATAGKVGETIAREALIRLKGSNEPSVKSAVSAALAKAKGTAQYVDLVRDFGAKGQAAGLLETALALGSDPAAVEAMKLLYSQPEAENLLRAAFASGMGSAIIPLLAASGDARGLDGVAGIISDDLASESMKETAIRALARTQTGAARLVKLARDGKFPQELKSVAAAALAAVQYANLQSEIVQHFPMPGALGGKPLPPIAELVKMKGDAAKGKAIAERAEATCISCHRIGAVGVDFGPALSEIGGKLPKEALYDAIINPNSGVSMGFETWQFALKDGGTALGLIRSETPYEVTLALPGGATQKIPRDHIAKREKQTTSMMPSGLNQALSQQDLIDLVEYLASLKAK